MMLRTSGYGDISKLFLRWDAIEGINDRQIKSALLQISEVFFG
jgi:hypothetical protein